MRSSPPLARQQPYNVYAEHADESGSFCFCFRCAARRAAVCSLPVFRLLYTVFQHVSVQRVQHDERDHRKPLALPGDVIRQSLPETVSEERKPYVFVVLLVVMILVPLLIALIICSRRPRGAIDGHGGHGDGDHGDNDEGDDDNNNIDDLSLTDRLVRWSQQQHDARSGSSLQDA